MTRRDVVWALLAVAVVAAALVQAARFAELVRPALCGDGRWLC